MKHFKLCLSIIVVLTFLNSCSDNDCIEADDFGNFKTDIIDIFSVNQACNWEYEIESDCVEAEENSVAYMLCNGVEANADGTNSQIGNTAESTISASKSFNGEPCEITYKGIFNNGYEDTFNRCIVDCPTDDTLLNKFTFVGSGCPADSLNNDEKISLIREIYYERADYYLNKCKEELGYNSEWKPDDNIVSISDQNYIKFRVSGNVNFSNNTYNSYSFGVNSKYIQKADQNNKLFLLNSPTSFNLEGKWCRNGNIDDCICDTSLNCNTVGEFDVSTPNLELRTEFLRKGVMVTKKLPDGASVDGSGNYSGISIHPNFDYWKCINGENLICGSLQTSIYEENIAYEDSIEKLYKIDNEFSKTIGGLLVPSNISKYITNNPFNSCETQGEKIQCSQINQNYSIPYDDSSNTLNELNNGYFMPNNKDEPLQIKTLYPVKIAFRFISNEGYDYGEKLASNITATSTSPNHCVLSVNVDGSSDSYVIAIDPSKNWQFLTTNNKDSIINDDLDKGLYENAISHSFDSNFYKYNNATILNSNKYGVVSKNSNTNFQDFSSSKIYSINVSYLEKDSESNSTWKASTDSENINCTDANIAILLLPQNDILINKSGFVGFKSLPYNNGEEKNPTTYSEINITNTNVIFDIINPMYAITTNRDNNTILQKNFYEYIDNNDLISKKQSINVLTDNNSTWTTNEIFVRKGQIMRFSEKTWYDITNDPNGDVNGSKGYLIRNKLTYGRPISDNLAMRVRERLALMCNGTYQETVNNDNCIPQGDNGCLVDYINLCQDTNSSNYCPMGCYTDDSGSVCVNPSSTGGCECSYGTKTGQTIISGASSAKCNQCIATIKASTISPKIEKSLIQCYDLENYTGSVRNLTTDYINNFCETSLAGESKNNLTACDTYLGAKILNSILKNSDTYGNLGDLSFDSANISIDENSGEKIYSYSYTSSLSGIKVSSPSILEFMLVDNKCFDSNCWNDNYKNNNGNYQFSFSNSNSSVNGENLAVVLANANWDLNSPIYNPGSPEIDLTKNNNAVWIVHYNMENNENYGTLDSTSPYYFNSNGYLLRSEDNSSNLYLSQFNLPGNTNFSDLRLFFKIIDKSEGGCDGNYDSICKTYTGDNAQCAENSCISSYYNNSGIYTVNLKTPISSLTSEGSGLIIKSIIQPVIELMDGKYIGLLRNNNGELINCDSNDESSCYKCANVLDASNCTEDKLKDSVTFGKSCVAGDEICYKNCNNSVDGYRCFYMNDNNGFLSRFYKAVINDSNYQTILRLCFILMVTFYGMYYLMGMADFTQSEFIRRLVKIGFIYLMVGTNGWYYYNKFFVTFFKGGVDYIVFAIAGAFNYSDNDIVKAFSNGDFHDKSILFSGADNVISLILSEQVAKKIWGLLFVSFFGWIYVFLMYSALFTYIASVGIALVTYMVAQFFISLLLSFGPIIFVLFVFEKTKGIFDKWISNLVSFAFEQIFILTFLSLFNTIAYAVIKSVLSYKVCWRPIWTIPFFNINLMSFWKATSQTSPSGAASAIPGLFQILIVWLVADLMKQFINMASELSKDFGGGALNASKLGGDITKIVGSYYSGLSKGFKNEVKSAVTVFAKKTIGYQTSEDKTNQEKDLKTLRIGKKNAVSAAEKAVEKYKKDNVRELLEKSDIERSKELAKVYKNAFNDNLSSNSEYEKAFKKQFGNMTKEDMLKKTASMNTASLHSSSSIIGGLSNLARRTWDRGDVTERKADKISKGKEKALTKDEVEEDLKEKYKQEKKIYRSSLPFFQRHSLLKPKKIKKYDEEMEKRKEEETEEAYKTLKFPNDQKYKKYSKKVDKLSKMLREGDTNYDEYLETAEEDDKNTAIEFNEKLKQKQKSFVPNNASNFDKEHQAGYGFFGRLFKNQKWKDDYHKYRHLSDDIADEMKNSYFKKRSEELKEEMKEEKSQKNSQDNDEIAEDVATSEDRGTNEGGSTNIGRDSTNNDAEK